MEREFWALRNVDFEVKRGDRVGIVGHNGAGKSTLLKILSRITEPSAGVVRMNGRVASLLEVGTGFNPELTGRENIYLNGSILGMSRAEIARKFDEIVSFAAVERFLDTPVKRYSSGMYVRLAFAVAAHVDPDVLIVDEVLAVGDIQFQKKCTDRMKEMERDGRTILFVTHNMEAMTSLCTRCIVMDRGRKVYDGDVQGGKEHYLSMQATTRKTLKNHDGRSGSLEAEITEILLTPLDPDTGSTSVTVKFEQRTEVHGAIELTLGIDSADGSRLWTSRSAWDDMFYPASPTGSCTCDIGMLPLAPGRYYLSVALLVNDRPLDAVQHCAEFEILERQNGVYRHRDASFGALDLPCTFR